jgi:tetratricopeptide (TPR) repeat protein
MRQQMVSKITDTSEPSQNIDAYQLYLKGLFFFNKGTPPDYYKAIQFFDDALALDSSFANAHAMIASCYAALTSIGNVNPAAVMEKVRTASRNAIRLNSQLPQSYLSMAMLQMYFEFQFDEAFNNINKAFLISPNSSEAHYVASHYYTIINDKKRMVEEAELALRSDPLSLMKNNQLGEALLCAQRPGDAEKQLLKTLEINPSWRTPLRNLGFVNMALGNYQKCFEMFDQIRREVNQPGKGITGYIAALALLGRKEEAHRWLNQLLQRAEKETDITLEGDIGFCFTLLGDLDKAFYYLNLAYEKRVGTIFFGIRHPLNTFLKKDERFWQLLERMGLKDYYEKERNS